MDSIIAKTEDLLIGRKNFIDASEFCKAEARDYNEKRALLCIHYILTDLIGWSENEIISKFDSYMIKLLKMEKIISYIYFPPGIPYGNARYILSLLYPDTVKIDKNKMAEQVFKDVIHENIKQFPRGYFSKSGDGYQRYCHCVAYLLENYHPVQSVRETFEFILSADGKRFLNRYRLLIPADQLSIDLIDVAGTITRKEEMGNVYYYYYKFRKLYRSCCA